MKKKNRDQNTPNNGKLIENIYFTKNSDHDTLINHEIHQEIHLYKFMHMHSHIPN